MKKYISRILGLLLAISLLFEPVSTSAKTKPLKLNKTKVTITAGNKTQLKVSGTKKKVSWSVKNKKIATVSKKGLVKAIKKGTTFVYAKVSGKKKLHCKVIVKAVLHSSASSKYYTFRNSTLLAQHYEKHGRSMGFASAEEYTAAANRVISNPASLHKKEQEDGDDVYYLEKTNDFVIVSTDGYIRTYFRPDDGIDYFNRQ